VALRRGMTCSVITSMALQAAAIGRLPMVAARPFVLEWRSHSAPRYPTHDAMRPRPLAHHRQVAASPRCSAARRLPTSPRLLATT
jgi:hypothetical protein